MYALIRLSLEFFDGMLNLIEEKYTYLSKYVVRNVWRYFYTYSILKTLAIGCSFENWMRWWLIRGKLGDKNSKMLNLGGFEFKNSKESVEKF